MPSPRALVSAGAGLAILETDFEKLIEFVVNAAAAYNPKRSTKEFSLLCTYVAQLLKHSIFPVDTYAFGNFRRSQKFDFQLGRLEASRGEFSCGDLSLEI
jgi:hypothetical protein